MTPIELQDALVAEIKRILKPYEYKTPAGERVPMNVFAQSIPIQETDEEEDPIPYVIVRLSSGENPLGKDSFNTVSVVLVIGIYDNNQDAQGYRDVSNVIQKVYERFSENPCLNYLASYVGDFQWALQEDNYYPYHFGACHMKFHIAAVRREDPLT